MAAGVLIAIAVPLVAAVANAALHWRRWRPAGAAAQGRRGGEPRLGTQALVEEVLATLLVFAAPLAALVPHRRPAGDALRPLVVVHHPLTGLAAWLLLRRLRGAGWQVSARATTARPRDAAEADAIAASLLADSGGDSIPLLGIGGGGLLARQLAARQPRFSRVVTLATPHQGTTSVAAGADLRPDSEYVAAVIRMDALPRRFDAVAVYSDTDAWIEPRQAAYCPSAFNLEVHDIGHFSMLFSRRVYEYVAENLTAPRPADLAGRADPS